MGTPEIDPITAELLHGAVHDLRGPANRLRLLAQLLGRSDAALDEDARTLLVHIEKSAADVGVVADGLRNYVEICARPARRETVDLNAALASASANLQAEMESAGAEITSSALPSIQGDPFLMTWLLQELLANAIRFREGGAPRILVSSGADGSGDWFVSVVDNGPGIDAESAEKVFRPFRKLAGGPGAGLGLTICRKIAELHQGRIWAEPRNGGAEFRFFTGGSPDGNSQCL